MTHRGFTIVEMIIAIGLGAVLVYTAASAFRVASQAMTVADALSLDNAMMRSGYVEAHDQIDFWTAIDDPDDPAKQRLRGVGSPGDQTKPPHEGLPFAPLKTLMDYKSSSVPRFSPSGKANGLVNDIRPRPAPSGSDAWEDDVGWDPSYSWAPHDPRTWYQGNMAEKIRFDTKRYERDGSPWRNWEWTLHPPAGGDPDPYYAPPYNAPRLWFGRYALFCSLDDQPVLRAQQERSDPVDANEAQFWVTYGGVSVAHRWYCRQLFDLHRAFGYYGFLDYVPTNSIYEWYGSENWWTNTGGLHQRCNQPWWDFCNDDGAQCTGRGVYRQSYATSFALIDPPASGSDWSVWNDAYRHFVTDYGASDSDANGGNRQNFAEFQAKTGYRRGLLPLRPVHWPDVSLSVGRYVKSGRFAQLARIRIVNPRNGEASELSFAATGTTLRGARLQRRPDQGWAAWDNDDPSKNDPSLDSY